LGRLGAVGAKAADPAAALERTEHTPVGHGDRQERTATDYRRTRAHGIAVCGKGKAVRSAGSRRLATTMTAHREPHLLLPSCLVRTLVRLPPYELVTRAWRRCPRSARRRPPSRPGDGSSATGSATRSPR